MAQTEKDTGQGQADQYQQVGRSVASGASQDAGSQPVRPREVGENGQQDLRVLWSLIYETKDSNSLHGRTPLTTR